MLDLRQRYVDALVAGDLALAERLIEDSGTDIRSLYLEVLQPALYEIGRRWRRPRSPSPRSIWRPPPPRA